MNAMVLCAGLGTRLRPISEEIPKPLVPLFDVPVVEYTFEILASAGVEKAAVNLHHLPEVVKKTLGNRCRGIEIIYSHEPEILGPVGGVARALEYVGDGPLLVVNGDILVDFDPAAIMKKHQETGAALTLALGDIPGREELRMVGVESKTGRVVKVRHREAARAAPDAMMVNLGVFVYDGRALKRYATPGKPFGFSDELIPALFEAGETVMSVEVKGYWNDIGNAASYLRAHLDALEGRGTEGCIKAAALAARYSGEGFSRPFYIGDNVTVGKGASIGPLAAVGRNSVIGEGARIERSVVMPGSSVAAGAEIMDSVVLGKLILKA